MQAKSSKKCISGLKRCKKGCFLWFSRPKCGIIVVAMTELEEMERSPRVIRAAELHAHGYNCAQAVMGAFAEDFGIPFELGLKLACGLGGGIGGNGDVCGTVSSAALLLGLKYGPDKSAVYPRVKEFTAAFTARTGSLICRELLAKKDAWPCRALVMLAVYLLESRLK